MFFIFIVWRHIMTLLCHALTHGASYIAIIIETKIIIGQKSQYIINPNLIYISSHELCVQLFEQLSPTNRFGVYCTESDIGDLITNTCNQCIRKNLCTYARSYWSKISLAGQAKCYILYWQLPNICFRVHCLLMTYDIHTQILLILRWNYHIPCLQDPNIHIWHCKPIVVSVNTLQVYWPTWQWVAHIYMVGQHNIFCIIPSPLRDKL